MIWHIGYEKRIFHIAMGYIVVALAWNAKDQFINRVWTGIWMGRTYTGWRRGMLLKPVCDWKIASQEWYGDIDV